MKKVVLFFGIAAAVALASCDFSKPAVQPTVEVEEIDVIDPIVPDNDEDFEITEEVEEGAE